MEIAILSQPLHDHLRRVFPSEEALRRLLERLEQPLVAVTAVVHEAALAFVVAAASLHVAVIAVVSTLDGAACRLRRRRGVVALEDVLAGHCVCCVVGGLMS